LLLLACAEVLHQYAALLHILWHCRDLMASWDLRSIYTLYSTSHKKISSIHSNQTSYSSLSSHWSPQPLPINP
jgi:hypothetical protein